MADANMNDFGKRLTRISKRHNKLARGYVTVVNADGLLVAQPRRQQMRFPWKAVALILALFFAFKGTVLANLGEVDYATRVASLQAGPPLEQFGGWAMQADPLTVWISAQILPYL